MLEYPFVYCIIIYIFHLFFDKEVSFVLEKNQKLL